MENGNVISIANDSTITSKTQISNADISKKLHLNGNIERFSNLTASHVIHEKPIEKHNATSMLAAPMSSEARHLPSNRRSTTNNSHSRTRRNIELTNDVDPLLETELIPKAHPPLGNPELDNDEPDNDGVIPNTPQNNPGVDDGFFPSDAGPRIGDDDNNPKRGFVPNGNVPPSRLSSSNFPYAPGFNVRINRSKKR